MQMLRAQLLCAIPCAPRLHSRPSLRRHSVRVVLSSASSVPSDDGQKDDLIQNNAPPPPSGGAWNWRRLWQAGNAPELRSKVAALGLSAVLAYGLLDGITYTTFFVLAFLGYEKSTGKNPAANLKALLGIVVLMWTGNNVTRPFRVAGAAALAPALDRFLERLQRMLKLPSKAFAFMLAVASFASLCFTVAGLLILSRWKG